MEKYFGNAYRGDPGVPHADPDRFVNIWIGSFAFSALTWVNPYMWQLSNQFNRQTFMPTKKDEASTSSRSCFSSAIVDEWLLLNSWHDKAMLFEQYHWKKAMAKKQPYEFKWNQYMDKEARDSYYFNWPMVGRWYAFMRRFDGCYMSCPLFKSIDLDTLMCSFFCNSSDEEGTARVPFSSNPYSFLVFSSKLKNAGSLGPNATTNLFGYSLLNAKTAKCPFTLSGTVNVAALVFVQNHLILAFYIAEV
ncbi:unnamed protein product [Camellia sinensis]